MPAPLPGAYPCLCYEDALSMIAWLERAFGFKRRFVAAENGQVLHAELGLGGAVIMISSPKPERSWGGARALPHRHAGLCVYVEDPDSHYVQALANGVEILQEIRSEDYGARGYLACDPEGQQWYFSDYIAGSFWDERVE